MPFGQRPVHQLAGQSIPRLAERSHHGGNRGITRRLADAEAAAGEDTLVACIDQACIELDQRLGNAVAILAMEAAQVADQFQIGLQALLLVAQRLNPPVVVEGIEQAPSRPAASSRDRRFMVGTP